MNFNKINITGPRCYDQIIGPLQERPGRVIPLLTTFDQRNYQLAGKGLLKKQNYITPRNRQKK